VVGVDKKKIVSLFLKTGVLLQHDELEWLARQDAADITAVASSANPKEALIQRVHTQKFEIIKSLESKPKEKTPELQSRFLNSRYEQMKSIVNQRISRRWTSLNRLPARGEVFLAGIVRDIREGEKTILELEDPTGSAAVAFDEKPDIQLDDFIALRANAAGKILFGKELLRPDIPIRPATKGSGRGCFISDLHLEEAPPEDAKRMFAAIAAENVDWVFVAGDIGNLEMFEELACNIPVFIIPGEADTEDPFPRLPLKPRRSSIISLSDPSLVRIGGLNVLLCHNFEQGMLPKRHLGPSAEVLENDFLVLDQIPDIVGYGHNHKPLVSNYKATTLANAGSLLTTAKPVVVDFETREWKQLDV
jgi:DNA polymerase II small subunit/DNA polymerase delta subunit B